LGKNSRQIEWEARKPQGRKEVSEFEMRTMIWVGIK
jgi:hypothetical protein